MNDPFADSALERAFGLVPGLAGARVVTRLSDGPTNASYRLEQGGEGFVLRLDKPGAAKLALDRRNEERISRLAADAGIAPRPLHFDADNGLYLRRFLSGRSWTPADLHSPENRHRLAGLLRAVHALPAEGSGFDPLAAARRYASWIGNEASASRLGECERLAAAFAAQPMPPALCHNDLVCENIIEADALMLIDWEYAGLGDPFFDLAVVVQHHGLDESAAGHFLLAYLGRKARAAERRHLRRQCRFYQALLDLWDRITPTL